MNPTGQVRTFRSEDDDTGARPTAAGCLLTLLAVGVIVGLAVPIVMWRDADGRGLPRFVAIAVPVIAGAVLYGIGVGVLRLFGIAVLTRSEDDLALFDDGSSSAEQSAERWKAVTAASPVRGEIVETIAYDEAVERHRITLLKRDVLKAPAGAESFVVLAGQPEGWFYPSGGICEQIQPTHWRRRRPGN